MNERSLARMLAPLTRAIGNMLARGTVVLADSASKMQALQVKLLSGEAKDAVEHFEPYGYTSCPHSGAEHVTLFLAGDRSHGVTVVVADRRYRLKGLAAGEVAMYTDEGDSIVMKRGRTIEVTAGTKVKITAPEVEVIAVTKVTLTTPLCALSGDLTVGGSVTAQGDVTAGSISLQSHVHGGVTPGGSNTGVPQ